MIGKIYKKIVNKKIVSNKNSRIISLLHGRPADSLAIDKSNGVHILYMRKNLLLIECKQQLLI